MDALWSGGSLGLVVAWLVIGGLGLPLPEDAALLAAGALPLHGGMPLPAIVAIVMVAVLGGDLALFLLARRLGPAAFQRRTFRRLLPPERRAKVEAAFARHGGKVVFFARHIVGIRAATFALAGIHGMSLRRFLWWDTVAACLSVPLVVGVGYLGAHHLPHLRDGVTAARHVLLGAVLAIAAGYVALRVVRARRAKREVCRFDSARPGDSCPR